MSAKKNLIEVMAGVTTGTILSVMIEKINKFLNGVQNSFDKLYKVVDQQPPQALIPVVVLVKKDERLNQK
jgi:ABC-type nitrate/sulfonate/bicarbonate transport system permease component